MDPFYGGIGLGTEIFHAGLLCTHPADSIFYSDGGETSLFVFIIVLSVFLQYFMHGSDYDRIENHSA